MITNRQKEIYTNLMGLVAFNDAFYFQDFEWGETTYRIFNYRLASYTDFLMPDAVECRGIMFAVENDNPAQLVSRPMQKFFNRFENPITMDVDLTQIESISNKADGSLISTWMHDGDLRLKTKGSISSDQALAAMRWMEHQDCRFVGALRAYHIQGYTVNMEWVAPDNRIVLGYIEPRLIVLNIRHRDTGKYEQITQGDYLYQYMDPPVDTKGLSLVDFVDQIPTMTDDIEGFVVKMKSGLWMKIKTKKYLSLHHCKDSVNNPRRLFEAIIDEGVDDIKSMFHEDRLLIAQIEAMQTKVDHLYNTMVTIVEDFYNTNKQLDRKEFAVKAQSEIDKLYFGLVMNLYLGKPAEYKEFLKKKFKYFGIKDEKIED